MADDHHPINVVSRQCNDVMGYYCSIAEENRSSGVPIDAPGEFVREWLGGWTILEKGISNF
ncbi:hypothetical protein NC652_023337 [Populus alba x Populus x berolinensis]|nr:hypothetical protein NC652_023337 [Populus alba x Populus x berolinensis]